MKRARQNKVDPYPDETEFHVLFNAADRKVRECVTRASCLLECEERLRTLHPEAVYWEVGLPD